MAFTLKAAGLTSFVMAVSTAREQSSAVDSIIIANIIVDNIGIQYRYCQMLDWGSRLLRELDRRVKVKARRRTPRQLSNEADERLR